MEITAILTIDNENDIGNDIDYDIDNNSENYNNFDKNNDREFVVRKFRAQMLHHPLLTIWQPKLEAWNLHLELSRWNLQ